MKKNIEGDKISIQLDYISPEKSLLSPTPMTSDATTQAKSSKYIFLSKSTGLARYPVDKKDIDIGIPSSSINNSRTSTNQDSFPHSHSNETTSPAEYVSLTVNSYNRPKSQKKLKEDIEPLIITNTNNSSSKSPPQDSDNNLNNNSDIPLDDNNTNTEENSTDVSDLQKVREKIKNHRNSRNLRTASPKRRSSQAGPIVDNTSDDSI